MTRHQQTLGIITNNRSAVFQRNVIIGIQDVAAQRGYEIVIDSIAEDPANRQPISLNIPALAGVLIIANVLSDDELNNIYQIGKPISLVSHHVPRLPIPAVVPNNIQGIAMLVHYLVVECGRRHIVFIRGDLSQNDAIQREAAFRHELMRHHLQIPDVFFLKGDFIASQAAQSLQQFIQTTTAFDAVLASDYLMAAAAMQVLEDAGINVPDDVCVVGFGDGPEAAEAELTTVAADVVDLGRRGARQLVGQLEGLHIRGLTVLNTAMVERKSCKTLGSSQ